MLLEVNQLSFSYGQVRAVHNASLTVREGEAVALLGANGAGKSSLINAISRINVAVSGSIRFDGRDISSATSHDVAARGLIQVPERRHLFPYLSVEDNLRLGAFPSRVRSKMQTSLNDVYQILPVLQELRRRRAETLSGGQQQMLAIGRGLMSDPRLLMLDEPSLGLAPIIVAEIFELFGLLKERGVSLLLVEQNVTRSLEFVDRGYAMQEGHIVLEGSAASLRSAPDLKDVMLGMADISKVQQMIGDA